MNIAVAFSRRTENIDADNPPTLHLQSMTQDDKTACGLDTTATWWELDIMDINGDDFARHGCRRCVRHWKTAVMAAMVPEVQP